MTDHQRLDAQQPEQREIDNGIDQALDLLYARRGLDFRRYRRSTIERRMGHRLAATHSPSYAAYLETLAREPGEIDRLVGYLTLKVTGFFRNPSVFNLLSERVLPELVKGPRLRIWSAGCATGEEVYSLAILVEEALAGAHHPDLLIIGSDIDEQALATARVGRYPNSSLSDVPSGRLACWFSLDVAPRATVYIPNDQVRSKVEFARHNLVAGTAPPPWVDAPGCDLILCRNVLIYFERSLQEQVLKLLDRALRPGGYLVLGEAESLPLEKEHDYECVDRRARVYRKKPLASA